MRLRLSPGRGESDTAVQVIDDRTVRIAGNDYYFPDGVSDFDHVGPILGAAVDDQGLSVTISVSYTDATAEIWETASGGSYRGSEWETHDPGPVLGDEQLESAGTVVVTGKTPADLLAALKAALCATVEDSKAALLRAGIIFRGGPITCDDEALRLLTSYCSKDAQGRLAYPASWLRPDRSILILETRSALVELSDMMEMYAEDIMYGLVTAQAAINSATTIVTAQAAFDAWAQEVSLEST